MGTFVSTIYHVVFYRPLLNGLFFLTTTLPGHDLGTAIIILTIIIRFIVFPFQHKMMRTQRVMKQLEPEIKRIQQEKKNKEEQTKALMELYRAHGINPLSGFLSLFIQLPLLIALFGVFRQELLAQKNLAYFFVRTPEIINTTFLGFIDLSKPHIAIAILAGFSQFIQARLATPPSTQTASNKDFSSIMQKQMTYMLPVMIFFFGLQLPAAVALYWTVMNIFAIVHEAIVRKKSLSYGSTNPKTTHD